MREPEGNGWVERFIRTLEVQLLWIRSFRTIEGLRVAIHEFRERYNREWIVKRHGYRTPNEVRRHLLSAADSAA